MRAELAMQTTSVAATQMGGTGANNDLVFWRKFLTFAYFSAVGCALLAGPIRRAVWR